MRKDIEIHIETGDMAISAKNLTKLFPFHWTTNESGLSRYIYGEIEVPGNISETSIRSKGIYLSIPYTPEYKEFYIRIKRIFGSEIESFVQNPVDGSEWFLVRTGLHGKEMKNAYASQLLRISEDRFYIKLNREYADLYSGNISDVNIISANRQNANLLLKCLPTNNYRYPLTGVGLIRWTNSNIDHTQLSTILQREFEADGVYVKNASFDFESKDLQLDLDTSNVDGNGTI